MENIVSRDNTETPQERYDRIIAEERQKEHAASVALQNSPPVFGKV